MGWGQRTGGLAHRLTDFVAESQSAGSPVRRLVGVYDAKGSLAGEVACWVGGRLGRPLAV